VIRAFIDGVGLVGPGLRGWQASRATLAGQQAHDFAATDIAASDLLPAAERRRAGVPVKLALAAGQEALGQAGRDATSCATVFASSSGDCDNVHHILEALAAPARDLSPTRFHNSVHNAAAGYWGIATQCRAPSTSLCGHDASFAAGLLEAAVQVTVAGAPVLLIAYDHPYPEPLHAARSIGGIVGMAMLLVPGATAHSLSALDIEFLPRRVEPTRMADPGLEALRDGVPAARSLPLLAALAGGRNAALVLDYAQEGHLRVEVTPRAAEA
jgi:hypothetical protein